ncbi:MAG: DUF6732 family protein [Cohaesibacteraceae bacterium]
MKSPAFFLTTCLVIAPKFAHAHPGHVAEAAGHSHWIAIAALAVSAMVVVWALVRKFRLKDAGRENATTAEANETTEQAT